LRWGKQNKYGHDVLYLRNGTPPCTVRRHGGVMPVRRDVAHSASWTEERDMMETNAIEHHQEINRPQPDMWGPACNYIVVVFYNCLNIKRVVPFIFSVHVGIDVVMTRDKAQTLMDRMGGSPLIAYLVDDDGKGVLDRIVMHIPMIRTQAGDGGLSAEFYAEVNVQTLNVDGMNEGLDEVYALVELVEPHGKQRFTSGVIAAAF